MGTNSLGNLFGRNPITPIQEHMVKAQSCAEELSQFFNALLAGDWDSARSHQQSISSKEREADEQKKQVRLHLPKSLFMPMPRSDLLALVSVQDKIANSAKDIAGLMIGRKMQIPDTMAEPMREYLAGAIETSAQALKAIQEIDELLESGFRGREIELVESLIEQLDHLEHQNDQLEIQMRASLFELEKNLPPIDVMFLYKIIDWIGELADRAQDVGQRLQTLIAR